MRGRMVRSGTATENPHLPELVGDDSDGRVGARGPAADAGHQSGMEEGAISTSGGQSLSNTVLGYLPSRHGGPPGAQVFAPSVGGPVLTAGWRCWWRLLRVRLTLGVAGHEMSVRPDTAPGRASRPARLRLCRDQRSADADPRSSEVAGGATPHLGMPRLASARMEPDSPVPPPLRGHSQPAVLPGRVSTAASRWRRTCWPTGWPSGYPASPTKTGTRLFRLAFRLPAWDCWSGATPGRQGRGCENTLAAMPRQALGTGGRSGHGHKGPFGNRRPGRLAARSKKRDGWRFAAV